MALEGLSLPILSGEWIDLLKLSPEQGWYIVFQYQCERWTLLYVNHPGFPDHLCSQALWSVSLEPLGEDGDGCDSATSYSLCGMLPDTYLDSRRAKGQKLAAMNL